MTRHKNMSETVSQAAWLQGIPLLLAVLASSFAGCSESGLDVAPVSGVLTLDGKPVDKAGVVFQPQLGPIATAITDDDGRFQLMTGDNNGALVGEHQVTVTKAEAVGFASDYGGTMGAPLPGGRKRKYDVPVWYAQTSSSGLKATVERDKNNEVDLSLSSKEPTE